MRRSHEALIVVAMAVMAMLSITGICTEFPPEHTCSKILYSSGCDDRCPDDCFRQLQGDGLCIGNACQCSYLCRPLTCLKVLSYSGCDGKTCHSNCFVKLKGNGACLRDTCWCSYTCKSPLLSPSPSPSW